MAMKNLTFGFEIEFAVALLQDGKVDPHPDEPRSAHGVLQGNLDIAEDIYLTKSYGMSSALYKEAYEHIACTLRNTGLPTISCLVTETHKRVPQSWVVDEDPTISHPIGSYNLVQIELRLPVLYLS